MVFSSTRGFARYVLDRRTFGSVCALKRLFPIRMAYRTFSSVPAKSACVLDPFCTEDVDREIVRLGIEEVLGLTKHVCKHSGGNGSRAVHRHFGGRRKEKNKRYLGTEEQRTLTLSAFSGSHPRIAAMLTFALFLQNAHFCFVVATGSRSAAGSPLGLGSAPR